MNINPEVINFDAPGSFAPALGIFRAELINPRIVGVLAGNFNTLFGVTTIQIFDDNQAFFPRNGISFLDTAFTLAPPRAAIALPARVWDRSGYQYYALDHILPGPPHNIRIEYHAGAACTISICFLTTRQIEDPLEMAVDQSTRFRRSMERLLGDQMVRRYGMGLRALEDEKSRGG